MSHRIATSTAARAASLARGRASQSPSSAAAIRHRAAAAGAISGSSASITNTSPSSPSLDSSRCYSTNYIQQHCNIASRLPASSALQILPSNSRFGVPSTLSSTRRAAISSTPLLLDKDEAAAAANPAAAAATEEDEDDACPPWQNPLHHNNPEFQKIFDEDFEPGEEMPVVPLPPFAAEEGTTVLATPHLHELADEIVRLNLLEVKELIDRMGDHFGFDDEVDMSGMGGGGGDGGGAAAAVEEVVEKVIFDLKLTGFDAKSKIKVIKEIRSVTTLGLKEAKELVEGAPTTVKKDIKKEEAEELKAKLEAVGATIEIV